MVFVGYVAVFLPSVVTLLTLVWQLFISRPEKNPVGGVAVAVSVLAGTGVAWLMFEGASVATGVSLDPLCSVGDLVVSGLALATLGASAQCGKAGSPPAKAGRPGRSGRSIRTTPSTAKGHGERQRIQAH